MNHASKSKTICDTMAILLCISKIGRQKYTDMLMTSIHLLQVLLVWLQSIKIMTTVLYIYIYVKPSCKHYTFNTFLLVSYSQKELIQTRTQPFVLLHTRIHYYVQSIHITNFRYFKQILHKRFTFSLVLYFISRCNTKSKPMITNNKERKVIFPDF